MWTKIVNIGVGAFLLDASRLLGNPVVLASTWCLDADVIQHLTADDLSRVALTCIGKELCSSDVECISKIVGSVNSENLMVATQTNQHKFNRVPRLPILTYNANDVLVISPPTPSQIAFLDVPAADRQKRIFKESSDVYRRVAKIKAQKRRKN